MNQALAFYLLLALSLAVAGLCAVIIVRAKKRPWLRILGFALAAYLPLWGAAVWLPAAAPPVWGFYFLPVLVTGVIFFTILTLFPISMPPRDPSPLSDETPHRPKPGMRVLLGVMLFFMLLMLAFATVMGILAQVSDKV